jgi:hypothetical protein
MAQEGRGNGEYKYNFMCCHTGHYMEVCGPPHTLALLTTGERTPGIHWGRLGGPQSHSDILKKRKVSCYCQDSKPKLSSLAPLTYENVI